MNPNLYTRHDNKSHPNLRHLKINIIRTSTIIPNPIQEPKTPIQSDFWTSKSYENASRTTRLINTCKITTTRKNVSFAADVGQKRQNRLRERHQPERAQKPKFGRPPKTFRFPLQIYSKSGHFGPEQARTRFGHISDPQSADQKTEPKFRRADMTSIDATTTNRHQDEKEINKIDDATTMIMTTMMTTKTTMIMITITTTTTTITMTTMPMTNNHGDVDDDINNVHDEDE